MSRWIEYISKIGMYSLIKPIPFDIFHNRCDGLWYYDNEKFGLNGCGETYTDAMENLQKKLEGLVIHCMQYYGSNFSESLRDYLDFDYVYNSMLGNEDSDDESSC